MKLRPIYILFLCAGLFLAACGGKKGDFFTGHQVGFNRLGLVDIGDYRISIGEISSRHHSVPETRHFSFSWSPAGHRRLFQENGWRAPTEEDWKRYRDLMMTSEDWSRYDNPAKARSSRVKLLSDLEKSEPTAEYKSRVRKDGFIVQETCSGFVSSRTYCEKRLSLSLKQKLELARQALSATEPRCALAETDPPAVTSLFPHYKTAKLGLVTAISCK